MKIDIKWQTLIIISIGVFMSTLDGSILNIANPTIASAFNVSMQQIQWLVTSYMLVITATLIFFGRLGDQIGSQKLYAAGFLLFSLGSLFCSLSVTLSLLILSRMFQALGASMMMATGMGIISNTFPAQERGKALGITGSMVGIGNMAGPSLGGMLVANFPWQLIFLINVPIGLIAFFIACKYLPSQEKYAQETSYDIQGTLLFACGISIMVLALSSQAKMNNWLFLFAIIVLTGFYLLEKRSFQPMLDFELFNNKTFVIGNIMALGVYITQTSVFFLLPFHLEKIYAFSPAYSGLIMTIPPVTMAIIAPLAGNLSDKLGPKRIITAAFLLLTLSYLALSSLGIKLSMPLICSGLFLLGLAMGMFGSPNNSSILGSIPASKAGYAGGFIATVRNLAFAIGIAGSVAAFTAFLNLKQDMPFVLAYTASSRQVYLIAAFISLLGLIVSVQSILREKQS